MGCRQGSHGLALKADGSITGWGYNYWGQATPPSGNDFVGICTGDDHGLALKTDGSIVGWGDNRSGEATPPSGNDFVAIATGRLHSLALKADGSIIGWGYNSYGQATPPSGNDFVAISAGSEHSLAIKQVAPLLIEAVIKIRPKTLNMRSKGKWIMCRITLPEDYNVTDIDPDSILLEDEIEPDRVVWLGDEFAIAKFSRPALRELLADLEPPTDVELLVSGQLNDATPFEGTDTIRLIGKALRKKPPRPAILKRKPQPLTKGAKK